MKEGDAKITHREILNILLSSGWFIARVSESSHWQLKKTDEPTKRTTVPFHGNKDLPIGTVKQIEKDTGTPLLPRPQKKKQNKEGEKQ